MELYALENIYVPLGKNIIVRARGGCRVFFDGDVSQQNACYNFMEKALNDVMSSPSISTVVLGNRAVIGIETAGRGGHWTPDTEYSESGKKERMEKYKRSMYFTLNRLITANKKVIFMVDPPEFYFDPVDCLRRRPYYLPNHKFRMPCAVSRNEFNKYTKNFHQIIAEARNEFPTVKFIDAYEYFCDEKYCHAIIDGELLYRDNNHLNKAGQHYFAKKATQAHNT